ALRQQLSTAREEERTKLNADIVEQEATYRQYSDLLRQWRDRVNADDTQLGNFWLSAPMDGVVLNSDFRENLTNKQMKPSEQILRIGDKRGPWEIELKVPQKHIGQILQAFDKKDPKKELEVDLLLMSAPT